MTRVRLGFPAVAVALLAVVAFSVYQHAQPESDCLHSPLEHSADDPGRPLEDMAQIAADSYATVPECVTIRVTDTENAVATVAFQYDFKSGNVYRHPIDVPLERSSVGDGWLVMTTNRCED